MASFNADINLSVQVEKALAGIRKVESAIGKVQKISSAVGNIGKSDVSQTVRSLNVIKGSLTGVAKTVKFVANNFTQLGIAIAGVEALNFANNFKGVRGPVTEAAASLANLTDRALELAATQPVLTAQIAAGTVALAAFAPQIATVTTRVIKLAAAAAAAKAPLQALLNEYSKVSGAFDGSFAEFGTQFKTEVIEAYRRRLFEISETISELTSRQSKLKNNLDKFNSSSETAQKIANKLVNVRKRLNDELRAQNTLLAQATRNQRAFNEQAQVGTNLARSRASRANSGFANFSQTASRVNKDQRAVDKAIDRRQRKVEKFAKGLNANYGQAPLMLPSSELLDAGGRGIKRLSSYYGDLNTQIDKGLDNSRKFSEQLNAQADRAQTLPPIFKDVERALKRTNTVVNRAAETSRGVPTAAAGPVQSQTQGLRKLASLEQRLIAETAELEKRRITETVNLRETKALKSYNTRQKRIKFLANLQQKEDDKTAALRAKRLRNRKSTISNVAIGGAFPLLFGQSGPAAIGGSVGGGLGALLGPTGGFAGSLIGTVIGDLINAQTEIKNLAREMGLGEEATDKLVQAFRQAGQGAEDLAAAIQGVRGIGLTLEDQGEAIRLASQLAEEYGGKVDKVVGSFNKVATSGKASFADLAGIAGQGIPIFEQLEKTLGVSRNELLLLAKDGKLSAQTVVDALVDVGNAAEGTALRTEGKWQKAWRLVKEAATISLKAVGILLGVLYGDVNATTGDIAVSFGQLYRDIVVGAASAAAKIAEAFASVTGAIAGYADVFRLGGLNPIAAGISDAAKEATDRLNGASTALKGLTAESNDAFNPIKNIQLPGELENKSGNRSRSGGGAGSLPLSQELQLRQQILQAELALTDIETKRRKLRASDLGVINIEDQALYTRLRTEIKILELERQQALIASKVPEDAIFINKLFDSRLEKLQRENDFQREQNLLRGEQLKLERTLTQLRGSQQTDDIVQGLGRNIQDANSRNSSQMLALRIKQLRRQEDLIGGINKQLVQQRVLADGDDPKRRAAAIAEIKILQERKASIEALLPTLNKAEQQQLRFNQAFAAVTPAVNSLVGGLREVVAGTKTVEEAFADFLNTIADQLIQTAATMIAQYIAIGIAKAFAGLGGSPGGSSGFNLSGGGSSVGSGGLPGIDSLGGLFNGSLPFVGSGQPSMLAAGGTANGNQPYIVGENGPELFIPGVTGTVTNNDQFEAARNALSGGNSSSSEAFADNAETIGTTTSYTKERTLERERIASLNSNPIDVRAETTVINNVEYVTAEQFAKGMQSTARDAQARVLSDLRNRPATRARVGMR